MPTNSNSIIIWRERGRPVLFLVSKRWLSHFYSNIRSEVLSSLTANLAFVIGPNFGEPHILFDAEFPNASVTAAVAAAATHLY